MLLLYFLLHGTCLHGYNPVIAIVRAPFHKDRIRSNIQDTKKNTLHVGATFYIVTCTACVISCVRLHGVVP